MPFTLAWVGEGRVDAVHVGALTAGELTRALAEVVGDVHFDQLRSIVCDFRAVTRCSLQPADLENIGAVLYGAYVTNPRIVIVLITSDPDARSLIRRFLALELVRYVLHLVATPVEADDLAGRRR